MKKKNSVQTEYFNKCLFSKNYFYIANKYFIMKKHIFNVIEYLLLSINILIKEQLPLI